MMKPLVIILLTILLLSGCGLLRKEVAEPLPQNNQVAVPPKVKIQEGVPASFITLSYDADITYIAGGSETGLDGMIRIRKDSIIWISIRKFGLEAARVMLSQDSVWVMDRINSQYFTGDYLFFSKQYKLEVDYNLIESLLLANPLSDWSGDVVSEGCDDKVCKISYPGRYRVNQGNKGSMPEGSAVTDQQVTFMKESGRLLSNTISIRGENRKLVSEYRTWKNLQQQLFPVKTELTVDNQGTLLVLKLDADSYKMNEPDTYPFKIPGMYKPMVINTK